MSQLDSQLDQTATILFERTPHRSEADVWLEEKQINEPAMVLPARKSRKLEDIEAALQKGIYG